REWTEPFAVDEEEDSPLPAPFEGKLNFAERIGAIRQTFLASPVMQHSSIVSENSELFSELVYIGHDAAVNGILSVMNEAGLAKLIPDIVYRLKRNAPTVLDIRTLFSQLCNMRTRNTEEEISSNTRTRKRKDTGRLRSDVTGKFQARA